MGRINTNINVIDEYEVNATFHNYDSVKKVIHEYVSGSNGLRARFENGFICDVKITLLKISKRFPDCDKYHRYNNFSWYDVSFMYTKLNKK